MKKIITLLIILNSLFHEVNSQSQVIYETTTNGNNLVLFNGASAYGNNITLAGSNRYITNFEFWYDIISADIVGTLHIDFYSDCPVNGSLCDPNSVTHYGGFFDPTINFPFSANLQSRPFDLSANPIDINGDNTIHVSIRFEPDANHNGSWALRSNQTTVAGGGSRPDQLYSKCDPGNNVSNSCNETWGTGTFAMKLEAVPCIAGLVCDDGIPNTISEYDASCICTATAVTNDECISAISLAINPDLNCGAFESGTVIGATKSLEPVECSGFYDDDVWYSFVATETQHAIQINNIVGTQSLTYQLSTGPCNTLTEIQCYANSNSGFTATGLTIGTTYFIRVATWVSNQQNATFDICVGIIPPPPANDLCNTATVLSCGTSLIDETTVSGTENGDITGCNMGVGVWYQFSPTNSGIATAKIIPEAGFNIEVSVATSLDCNTFNNISCINGSGFGGMETVQWSYTASNTYYIYVGHSFGNDTGKFDIELGCDQDSDGIFDSVDLCPQDPDTALDFAGGNSDPDGDYISIPHDPKQNIVSGDFTLEAWIYPTDDNHKTILTKGHGFTPNLTDYIFGIWAAGVSPGDKKLGLYLSGEWQFSTNVIALNQWSHVAVTFEDATDMATFYINGSVDKQVTYTSSLFTNTDANPLLISRQGLGTASHNFVGKLDDIIIWNRALTISEIQETMAYPLIGNELGVVANYDFNDASACTGIGPSTLVDKGPHRMDGTLINFNPLGDCTSDWSSGRNLDSNNNNTGDSCDDNCTDDLSANLVSYWSFDNTVEDRKGNNDGTIIGSGRTYDFGQFGNGIDLDGGSTYIDMGNAPNLNMTNKSLTISAWFRVDGFTDPWQTIISKGEGDNYRIARFSNSDFLSYSGPYPDVLAAVDINDGKFHHVAAVTKNGEFKKIYIDGILYGIETNGTIITDGNQNLLIGNNPVYTQFRDWNGMLDDVAIWDSALTDCDIDQIFNSGMSLGDMLGFSPPCSNSLNLTGTQSTDELYQTTGEIISDQLIDQNAQVDYSAGFSDPIDLNIGFEVELGAVFHAFHNACQN